MTIEVEIESLECVNCGCTTNEDESTQDNNGDTVCSDCVALCGKCESVYSNSDDFTYLTDECESWCDSCTNRYAEYCDGNEHWHNGSTYSAEDRDGSFCERHIQDAYYCDSCDEYNFDGCDRCSSQEDDERVIHDYNYRPDPIFHATKENERLHFGMEIEVEAPRGDYERRTEASIYAKEMLEGANIAYLKSDGSLNCGFEIVTHPMSHDFFKNNNPLFWDTVEYLRTELKMRSWSTDTCGLHIHISRAGFGSGVHMHRFLKLIYSNEKLYSALAGRESSRWAKYTDVDYEAEYEYSYDDNGDRSRFLVRPAYRSFKAKIKNGRNSERYSAVNTQNAHTVEMRIFKGSLKAENIKACLDLAHASVEYTRVMSVREVMDGALDAVPFIAYIAAHQDIYPDLDQRVSTLLTIKTNQE